MASEPTLHSLSPTSKAALNALKSVSSLAWPILKTQSEILGLNPEKLLANQLPELVPKLADAVQRFSTPDKAEHLRTLLGMPSQSPKSPSPGPRSKMRPLRTLASFSQEVLDELEKYSPLAWSLLEAQCSRVHLDPTCLTPDALATLVPELEKSLARFGNPGKARMAATELEALARSRARELTSTRVSPEGTARCGGTSPGEASSTKSTSSAARHEARTRHSLSGRPR